MTQPVNGPLDPELIELHESFVWQVNAAVSGGRDDLAWHLAQEFPDEALERLAHSHD